MAISKVILNDEILLDVTNSTVDSQKILDGYTAKGADGVDIVGEYAPPTFTTQAKTHISPATSSQTITPDVGYDGLSSVQIDAMPSGAAGTPTAMKGAVSNHSVSITPSVTNSTGYITGGTKNGAAVIVSASELVSGSETKTENGTYDVTNLASVVVDVASGGGGSIDVEPLSVTSNGTYTAPTGTAYSPVTVNVSGGDTGDEGPIVFIDYDGTVVASYDSVPASLPSVPTHSGLTGGAWNYTLAQIEAQFNAMGSCIIGANYSTSSGKTEIDIVLDDPDFLSPYLVIAVNGTATVDWGDGSTTDTITGTSYTSAKFVQHTYASTGSYTISVSGPISIFASSNGYSSILRDASSYNYRKTYAGCVRAVRVGSLARIGNNAFNQLSKLESVSIPTSVTSFGNYAFNNCCSLTGAVVPSGVTGTGNYAFANCRAAANISIPSAITSIGTNAFQNCYTLKTISIPSSVRSIGNYAYQNCWKLKSAKIPSGVTAIPSYMLQYCQSIETIEVPSTVTSIGTYAFSYCYALTDIDIPHSMETIGNQSFTNCVSLESVSIPPSATIGSSAFNGCRTLTSVSIESGVPSIGDSAFANCSSLESISIPSTVTTMGNSAFSSCVSLRTANIPVGVTSVEPNLFMSCGYLESVTIPHGVTSIGASAFSVCSMVREIEIPSTVTSIGSNAFQSCYSVTEYHVRATTPPTITSTTFANIVNTTKIYVPAESLEAYQTATYWSTYASYMQGE